MHSPIRVSFNLKDNINFFNYATQNKTRLQDALQSSHHNKRGNITIHCPTTISLYNQFESAHHIFTSFRESNTCSFEISCHFSLSWHIIALLIVFNHTRKLLLLLLKFTRASYTCSLLFPFAVKSPKFGFSMSSKWFMYSKSNVLRHVIKKCNKSKKNKFVNALLS